MTELKFKLTSESKVNEFGVKLFRIEATASFGNVKKGYKGGWVESTHLPNGDARLSDNAWVSSNAQVYGNARVSGNAQVYGNARVSLNKRYGRGDFLYASDSDINTTVIDQSTQEGFDSSSDYKNLLVVGDFEISDIDEKPKETISFGGKTYEVTEELKSALSNLKEV